MPRPAKQKDVTPPWRKMRSWRGGWWIEAARNPDGSLRVEEDGLVPQVWEHWRTDGGLRYAPDEKALCLRRPSYVGAPWPGFRALVPAGAQHVVRYRRDWSRDDLANLGPQEVIKGGERNRVHDNPNPSPLGALPRTLTALLKMQEWKGSRVETAETPQGKRHTLHHPSGATMTLQPGVLHEEKKEDG